jgi:hypothetical protein
MCCNNCNRGPQGIQGVPGACQTNVSYVLQSSITASPISGDLIYVPAIAECLLLFYAPSADILVNLDNATEGKIYTIKNQHDSINDVIVNSTTYQIDGANVDIVLEPYEGVQLAFVNGQWRIINKYL